MITNGYQRQSLKLQVKRTQTAVNGNMPPMWPKAVIFDCDGVLIDSWYSTCFYFNTIRKKLSLPCLSPEEEAFVFISTIDEGLDRVIPEHLTAMALEIKSEMDYLALLPLIDPQPGIIDFLSFLLAHGIKTAVNTNGGHENITILHRLGLDRYFQAIVTADDVCRPKPGTEGVEKILAGIEIPRQDVVFIGDSSVDEETAHHSGLTFWAYNNRSLTADRHVDDFAALPGSMSARLQVKGGVPIEREAERPGTMN